MNNLEQAEKVFRKYTVFHPRHRVTYRPNDSLIVSLSSKEIPVYDQEKLFSLGFGYNPRFSIWIGVCGKGYKTENPNSS